MSDTEGSSSSEKQISQTSKKRNLDQAELEVDLDAPEPPSKKAQRKAKKAKSEDPSTSKPKGSDAVSSVSKSEDASSANKRSDYGIWIGNLSFTTTKDDLLDFMTSDTDHVIAKDQITRINLPAGKAKFGKFQNKGFAYIDLVDSQTLSKALELSEKLVGGRRVLIKNAKSFEGRPAAVGGDAKGNAPGHAPSKRVFVGNLAFDTRVEDLESHFGVCGQIGHTHMATFEDSGKCKGFAWIEFEQLSSAQAAMRGWVEEGKAAGGDGAGRKSDRRIWLHSMQGRKLRLEFAEDKTTRYQKRFGKDAVKSGVEKPGIEEVAETTAEAAVDSKVSTPSYAQERREKRRKVRDGGYAEDTVKRLTGAIVKAQGNKVTFD